VSPRPPGAGEIVRLASRGMPRGAGDRGASPGASAGRRGLSSVRERAPRPADVASRAGLIAHQRRRARRARRSARRLRAVGRAAAVLVTAGALAIAALVAADWVRRTPLLAIQVVEVQGARRLDEEAVRAAAAIAPGTNLLQVDVAAAEARVAALPGVRRAHVVRHLPHRVTVMVDEREPYALVNADGLHWVDAEGFLVTTDPRPGAPTLPILSGLAPPPAGAAGAPSERLRTGLALLRVLERGPARLAGRVSEIDLGGDDGPVLYLVDGPEVRVGTEGWADRLGRLDGVLAELDTRGERVSSIDLRFRDLVVLTPRPAPAGAGSARALPAAGRRRPAGSPETSATPAAARLERR
jgi:cell division septal protein FtsQ